MVKIHSNDTSSKKAENPGLSKISNRLKMLKQNREAAQINKAVIYFDDPKNKSNLTTGMT